MAQEPRFDELTAPAEERTLAEIRDDMDSTRESLATKIEALQDYVSDKVEDTRMSVSDTVAQVKDAAEALSLTRQVEQRPWLMLGAAVAVGGVAGYLVMGRRTSSPSAYVPGPLVVPPAYRPPEPPAKPSMFAEELGQLKGVAVGVGMALVREWLKGAAPALTNEISHLMDSATVKLGGTPIEGQPFAADITPGPANSTGSRFGAQAFN